MPLLDFSMPSRPSFSNSLQQKLASPAWTIFLNLLKLSNAYHAFPLHQQKHVQWFLSVLHKCSYSLVYAEDDQLPLMFFYAVCIQNNQFIDIWTG